MNQESPKLLPPPESDGSSSNSTTKRQIRQKAELLEELKRTPIIELVCKKVGIARATFYRWKKDDAKFADAIDEAIGLGGELVSDMAESQLLVAIRDGNFSAIAFWLKTHHRAYRTKVEVTAAEKSKEELTPEQTAIVKKALAFGHLIEEESPQEEHKNEQPAEEQTNNE